MSNAKNREIILSRIRQALAEPTTKPVAKPDFSSDLYERSSEDSAVIFASQLRRSKAEFHFCMDRQELMGLLLQLVTSKRFRDIRAWEEPVRELLREAGINHLEHDQQLDQVDAGITLCEYLIARTGSILVSSAQATGRRLTVYPPVHIIIAYTSQILPDIEDGLRAVKAKYAGQFPSMLCLVSGPSRTADIEKTLVLGAHGPKELIVILVDDSPYH